MPPLRADPTDDRIDAPAAVEREPGMGSVLGALNRQRRTIAGCFAASVLIGILVILVSPVRYQASTSILLDPRLGKSVGADPTTPGFVADSAAIDSQVKLLTSQTVLKRVADTLHLADDPDFSGTRWSVLRALGLSPSSPPGADLKTLENAISIRRPERTYLVEIQVSATTGEKAAAIANAVAEAYNEDQITSRVVTARSDARFIAVKREQLRKQIDDADRRIEAYKSENNVVSTDGLRSNEQQVADLTRELGTARGRASELKSRAEQVATIARSGHLDATAEALKSPTIERLRTTQADTERELAKLSETLGPRHPALMESLAQVQRVRTLITGELGRLRQSAENEYQVERRNETQLLAEIDRVKRQSTDTSSKIVPLRQMEREVDALRQSDERFARIGDTLTQQEGDTPPARVVAAARPPVSPAWPKRSLILAVSMAAGLFLALGAAFLRDGMARPAWRGAVAETTSTRPTAATTEPAQPRRREPYWDDDARVGQSRTPETRADMVPALVPVAQNDAPEKSSAPGSNLQHLMETLASRPVRTARGPIRSNARKGLSPAAAPASRRDAVAPDSDPDSDERAYYGSLQAKRPQRRLVWS